MTYHQIAFFTQTGVLLFFMAIFFVVLFYALNPKNRDKFRRAARMPLDDETTEHSNEKHER